MNRLYVAVSASLLSQAFALPLYAASFSLEGSNDVFVSNFNGTSAVSITGAQLALDPMEELSALSGGLEPLTHEIWDILFTVKRPSTGAPGSSVEFFQPQSPANIFFTNPTLQGTNRLLAPSQALGVLPTSNLDALEVFGPDESTMTNLQVGDNIFYSAGSSEIFMSQGNGMRSVFQTTAALGLLAGDVIDALAVGENRALFSLAAGSPTLLALGLNPGDVLFSDFDGGLPEIAGPTAGNLDFLFDLTAANLGLLPGDDLNGFDLAKTSTFLDIPQDANFPVDAAVVPAVPEPSSVLGLIAVLGVGSLLKRKKI